MQPAQDYGEAPQATREARALSSRNTYYAAGQTVHPEAVEERGVHAASG